MSNIAELGFAADTSELKDASATLRQMVPAAAAAEKASEKLGRELDNTASAAARMASGTTAASAAVDKAATGATGAASAAGKVASANEKVASSAKAAASGIRDEGNAAVVAGGQLKQYDAHIMAFHASNGRLKDGLNETSKSLKFTAVEGLNASRQLADIGVTLASGMSPFLIALQQGPQLFDIIQQKAVMTGTSISTVFRAAGAAIWAALLPILPIIAGIAIAAGAIVGAFALATRAINGNSKSIADGMNLTEKQLERVKKAGVDTSVTIGDTFKATFEVLGERFTDAFEKPIKKTSKLIDQVFNIWTTWGADTARNIIAAFTAAYYGIVALWKNMPKTFAGIGSLIANGFISVFELMINRALAQVNGINQKINGALKAVGIDFQFADLSPVKLGRVANGEASKAAEAFAKGSNDGWAEGLKKGDRLFADILKRARKDRRKLIDDAAGDGDATKKSGSKKPKKEAEAIDIARIYDDPFGQKDIDAFNKDTAMPSQIGQLTDVQGLDKVYEAYRQQVDFAKEATRGFIDDLRGNLAQGEGLFKSFANAVSSSLNRIFDKLLDKTLNAALEGLFGGNGGGLLGSLFGSVGKTAGPAQKSARGDVFGSPTLFRFNGGKVGQMGEAGEEAVMPLKRGPDGSLGVSMHGGGNEGGGAFAPNITINPTYVLSGAMSTADVQRSIRQAGDQQAQDLRKAIPGILQDYQMNGALA